MLSRRNEPAWERAARRQAAGRPAEGLLCAPACASQTNRQTDTSQTPAAGTILSLLPKQTSQEGQGRPQEPQGRPEEGRFISVQGLGLPGTFRGTRSRFCFWVFLICLFLFVWLVFYCCSVLKSCCEFGAAAFRSLSDVAWKQDFEKDWKRAAELNFLTPFHVTRVAPSEVWVGTTRDAFAGELGTRDPRDPRDPKPGL